jgi:purine-binding chemotaxis protein CheW
LASTASTPELATRQSVIFRLASRAYGIEVDAVREIIPFRGATRLPDAPHFVAGLINVRGTIVTVLDLGARLDGAPSVRGEGSVILVTHGAKLVGALVDEVIDIRHLPEAELDPVLSDGAGGAVRALARSGSDVIALLDIGDIISQVLV